MSVTAVQTQDFGSMVVEAHAQGYITKTKLNSLLNLLPTMKATFNGTMESVYEMAEMLWEKVEEFQKTIPTDGSMREAVGNQTLQEMVRTGFALIRKVTGLVEGAF